MLLLDWLDDSLGVSARRDVRVGGGEHLAVVNAWKHEPRTRRKSILALAKIHALVHLTTPSSLPAGVEEEAVVLGGLVEAVLEELCVDVRLAFELDGNVLRSPEHVEVPLESRTSYHRQSAGARHACLDGAQSSTGGTIWSQASEGSLAAAVVASVKGPGQSWVRPAPRRAHEIFAITLLADAAGQPPVAGLRLLGGRPGSFVPEQVGLEVLSVIQSALAACRRLGKQITA